MDINTNNIRGLGKLHDISKVRKDNKSKQLTSHALFDQSEKIN